MDQPEDIAIVFRIGLHLGDLIVEGDDHGDGVNALRGWRRKRHRADRDLGTVHDFVGERIKAQFEDLGSLTLKNIERRFRRSG
jgi:class 3 adenylate cyclase